MGDLERWESPAESRYPKDLPLPFNLSCACAAETLSLFVLHGHPRGTAYVFKLRASLASMEPSSEKIELCQAQAPVGQGHQSREGRPIMSVGVRHPRLALSWC
jgi:hypothetical protein